jgi:hypothetical protein
MFYATSANSWAYWTGLGGSASWNYLNGPSVLQNQWTHLVGVCDTTSGSLVFYVDGMPVAASSNAVVYQNLNEPLRIGASATEGPAQFLFSGDVDEVAIFDRQLSASEVQTHYWLAKFGAPVLQIFSVSPALILGWPAGTLQSAGAANGPYFDVPGAASPWTNAFAGSGQFFRVRY